MKDLALMFMSILLAVIGQLLLKNGMLTVGYFPLNIDGIISNFFRIFLNYYIIFGFVSFGLSACLWLVVLSRIDLSFAYPMVSLGYVIVALMSYLLFKEHISLIRWLGIFTICFGVFLISRT